jgi:hypothetical protein
MITVRETADGELEVVIKGLRISRGSMNTDAPDRKLFDIDDDGYKVLEKHGVRFYVTECDLDLPDLPTHSPASVQVTDDLVNRIRDAVIEKLDRREEDRHD